MSNFYNLKLLAKYWQEPKGLRLFPDDLAHSDNGMLSDQGIAKLGKELESLIDKVEEIENKMQEILPDLN
jgi:hypothetical protein